MDNRQLQLSKQAFTITKERDTMELLEYDLEFEKPLMVLAEKIRLMQKEGGDLENPTKIQEMLEELSSQMQETYANLSTWQTVQVLSLIHI